MDSINENYDVLIKVERRSRIFRGAAYCAIVITVFLFLVLGISWILKCDYYDHGGAGAVMALFYFAPILLLDAVMIVWFIIVSILLKTAKLNPKIVNQQYRRCLKVFIVEMILSFFAIMIIL